MCYKQKGQVVSLNLAHPVYTHFLQFRYLVLSLQGHENEYELRIK